MEVNISRSLKDEPAFPKLMQTTKGSIVLFEKERCGTVIARLDPGVYPVGTYSTTWDMGYFSDFYGEVTLSN